jgi:2-polyprenyl-3-methyl-5-hydroxy-6-metoxy-1,4-benzoquinol methylase
MGTRHVTPAEAIRQLRTEPDMAALIEDSYLDTDSAGYWDRFHRSAEFAAVLRLIGRDLHGLRVLDLGAGVGMAALSFARAGAAFVCAAEPDSSEEVGYRSLLARPPDALHVSVVEAFGETLPFATETFDLVYCRQVLHHARHLDGMVAEMARVTRRGGQVMATREHVVRNARDLARFLQSHPVHAMAGNEHAFRRQEYEQAFARAGLVLRTVLRPLESVINAFPRVRTDDELASLPGQWLARVGPAGKALAGLPVVAEGLRTVAVRRSPGSMYTFLATRP